MLNAGREGFNLTPTYIHSGSNIVDQHTPVSGLKPVRFAIKAL